MGLNFYYYDGLQPKMRAGIINEHECIITFTTVANLALLYNRLYTWGIDHKRIEFQGFYLEVITI